MLCTSNNGINQRSCLLFKCIRRHFFRVFHCAILTKCLITTLVLFIFYQGIAHARKKWIRNDNVSPRRSLLVSVPLTKTDGIGLILLTTHLAVHALAERKIHTRDDASPGCTRCSYIELTLGQNNLLMTTSLIEWFGHNMSSLKLNVTLLCYASVV